MTGWRRGSEGHADTNPAAKGCAWSGEAGIDVRVAQDFVRLPQELEARIIRVEQIGDLGQDRKAVGDTVLPAQALFGNADRSSACRW